MFHSCTYTWMCTCFSISSTGCKGGRRPVRRELVGQERQEAPTTRHGQSGTAASTTTAVAWWHAVGDAMHWGCLTKCQCWFGVCKINQIHNIYQLHIPAWIRTTGRSEVIILWFDIKAPLYAIIITTIQQTTLFRIQPEIQQCCLPHFPRQTHEEN